jgi:hypothetical protein
LKSNAAGNDLVAEVIGFWDIREQKMSLTVNNHLFLFWIRGNFGGRYYDIIYYRPHTQKETLAKSLEKSWEKRFWVQWAVDSAFKGLALSQGVSFTSGEPVQSLAGLNAFQNHSICTQSLWLIKS